MTSLVADLFINPIVRQARRLSRSSSGINTLESEFHSQSAGASGDSLHDELISETEEESYLGDDVEASTSSFPSSRSSVQPTSPTRLNYMREHETRQDGGLHPAQSGIPEPPTRDANLHGESTSITNADMVADIASAGQDISAQDRLRHRISLPEDDGMGTLRKRIFSIQARDLDPSMKALLMHQLFSEGHTKLRALSHTERPLMPMSPGNPGTVPSQGPLESFRFWQSTLESGSGEQFNLTDKDLEPTFAPETPTESREDTENDADSVFRPFGCEHYRRNVKMQCSACNRWYTCRFCHDKAEDHALIRKDTKNMLCMFCGTAQRTGEVCVACGASAARYYCGICKLWNDNPDKPCYHCSDCGICRIGRGIGKDFFHCKKCCACIAISIEADHKCIERSTDCDCPICGDYMFTSPKSVCFMRCGHSIHRQCYDEYLKTSYKCPICSKSLTNMESQFRNLDIAIEHQPMPPEFRDTRAVVLCNDCSARTSTPYHWLGLKCSVCFSYNTVQLRILGLDAEDAETDFVGRETRVPRIAALRIADLDNSSNAARPVRRRHSSNVMLSDAYTPSENGQISDRLARSVSPSSAPAPSLHASAISGHATEFDDDEEENDDMMSGFWRRMPRSIASNEDDDDSDGGSSDDGSALTSEDEEAEGNEADESDEDDFELLGHR